MKTIAVSNQKGGVAKTTTAVNLAAALGMFGQRTLLIDLDPQGNATMGVGIDKSQLEFSMVEVCLREKSMEEVTQVTLYENLSLVPANQDLTVAEVQMRSLPNAPFILRENLEILAKKEMFDVVVMDCPPALNILTVNAMSASDFVVVPIQCEYFALEGLTALLDTVSDLQKTVNPELHVLGFLRTMFDGRAKLAQEVSKQLDAFLKDKMFDTVVPRNIRLAEAPSFGMPVHYFDKSAKGAKAYHEFANEVLTRLKQFEEK